MPFNSDVLLHSNGGGRYNPLVLICSLVFRSTFFLLHESLVAAERDFPSKCTKEELHDTSPAAFGEVIPLANPSSSSHLYPWSPYASFHPSAIPGLM